MEISKEQREKIRKELMNKYEEEGFNYGKSSLGSMIIDDFVYDAIDEYDESSYLEDIVNNITGNYDGSYTCDIYKSAQLIADNIFEFNEIAEAIEENFGTSLNVVDTEKNLVCVLLYICNLTILDCGCETLEELIEELS